MSANIYNLITIAAEFKKEFLRKFTVKKRIVHFNGPQNYLAEPIEHSLCLNRIIRFPKMANNGLLDWLEQNWGTTQNAVDSSFFTHEGDDYDGMFEIIFNTAHAGVSDKILIEIAKRLHCDLEYLYLDEIGNSFGMKKVTFDPKEIQIHLEDDSFDNFENVVTRIMGCSDNAEDLKDSYRKKKVNLLSKEQALQMLADPDNIRTDRDKIDCGSADVKSGYYQLTCPIFIADDVNHRNLNFWVHQDVRIVDGQPVIVPFSNRESGEQTMFTVALSDSTNFIEGLTETEMESFLEANLQLGDAFLNEVKAFAQQFAPIYK